MGVAERRERERAERREQILDAAEEVFFKLGPVVSTMDDVARAAELSKGTLYLYFRSKDELYLAIAYRGLSRMVAGMERVVAAGEQADESGLKLLESVTGANREFARKSPQHLQTMLAWMASGFHASPDSPGYSDYLALVSRLMRLVVGLVERGKADGSIRSDVDSFQVVMHLWGGSMGMWLLNFNRDEVSKRLPMACDFEQLVPSFTTMLLRAIRNNDDRSPSQGDEPSRDSEPACGAEQTPGVEDLA